MKIFLSFKFTGESLEEITEQNSQIKAILEAKGHEVYNSLQSDAMFDEKKYSLSQRLDYFFSKVDEADCLLAFIKSDSKSEGMLLEIGYALSKKKQLALAIKNGVQTVFLREVAKNIIEFDSFDELLEKLKKEDL